VAEAAPANTASSIESRQRLLDAAAELLVRDGMSVSLEAIARHAGVSRMTLYRQLGRRDDVLLAVLTEQTARVGSVITPILDDWSRPFADRVVDVIVAVVMAVRESPVLTFFARRVTPDEVVRLDRDRSYLDSIWAYMQPWFDEAERDGQLRHDATSTLDWTLRQTLLQLMVEGLDTVSERGLRTDLERFFRPSIAR
jgi:AcrR family transcriptional regulator